MKATRAVVQITKSLKAIRAQLDEQRQILLLIVDHLGLDLEGFAEELDPAEFDSPAELAQALEEQYSSAELAGMLDEFGASKAGGKSVRALRLAEVLLAGDQEPPPETDDSEAGEE